MQHGHPQQQRHKTSLAPRDAKEEPQNLTQKKMMSCPVQGRIFDFNMTVNVFFWAEAGRAFVTFRGDLSDS